LISDVTCSVDQEEMFHSFKEESDREGEMGKKKKNDIEIEREMEERWERKKIVKKEKEERTERGRKPVTTVSNGLRRSSLRTIEEVET
jgi:hypothetical protein